METMYRRCAHCGRLMNVMYGFDDECVCAQCYIAATEEASLKAGEETLPTYYFTVDIVDTVEYSVMARTREEAYQLVKEIASNDEEHELDMSSITLQAIYQ